MKLSRLFFFPLILLVTAVMVPQQSQAEASMNISYSISWQQPNAHYFHVTLTLSNLSGKSTLVRIPAWRPGRYTIQNYARNVIDVTASGENGEPLPLRKTDKSTWRVEHPGRKRIVVKYRCYSFTLDAGSSYLDDSEAYINPITLLMYVPGKEMLPVTLKIQRPPGWKIATALDTGNEPDSFVPANYHELVDNPLIISPDYKEFSFSEGDSRIEIVLQGEANYSQSQLQEDIAKIVAAQVRVMGELPTRRYVFLYHLLPDRFGHGVEHKNSTSIVIGPANFDDPDFYSRFLGVTSHEFFHLWNVERIRPQAIYLPDYSSEVYTSTMWFFEGVTSYYGDLTLARGGLITREKYYQRLASDINRLQRSGGRKHTSAAEASWDSWLNFDSPPPPHTSVSFYGKGSILGLMLDLEIRNRTGNQKSLDEVMRYLYRHYAAADMGVPEDGLQKAVEKVAGSSFEEFFQNYVFGTAEIDYGKFLAYAGLETLVDSSNQQSPYLGIRLSSDNPIGRILSVEPQSPALAAGLDIDDQLIAIDGYQVNAQNLAALLRKHQPGESVTVTVFRHHRLRQFEVTLGETPYHPLTIREGEDAGDLNKRIRESWLGG